MSPNDEKVPLSIPEQDLKSLTFCDTKTKKFQQWVDSLPLFNTQEISQRLVVALDEIIRLKTDETTRVELLEILKPKINYACKSLRKEYLNRPFPLTEKAKAAANFSQLIESKAALAYKIVIVQFASKKDSKKTQSALCSALFGSLYYLSKSLLRCFQLYISAPRNFWKEFNHLYIIAEDKKLTKETLSIELDGKEIDSDIETIYKQTLCLSVIRPNQLRQKDIHSLFNVLHTWSQYLKINESFDPMDIYGINTLRDTPPGFISDLSDLGSEQYRRYLTTKYLATKIREYLNSEPLIKPEQEYNFIVPRGVTKETLGHLKIMLSKAIKRQHNRRSIKGELTLAFGIVNTHYFLNDQTEFNRIIAAKAEPETINLQHGKIESVDDEEERHSAYRITKGKIVNQSKHGYCIFLLDDCHSKLSPGEILVIYDENPPSWRMACVRWIKLSNKNRIHIGIKLILDKVLPCAIRSVPKKGESTDYLRAFMTLLHPSNKPSNKIMSGDTTQSIGLMMPNLQLNLHHKYYMRHYENEVEINIKQKLESTPSYQHFEIETKEHYKFVSTLLGSNNEKASDNGSTQGNKEGKGKKGDENTIWASL